MTFLIFYLLSSSFFFSDFTFYKEALSFIAFILSLYSNTSTLESIFEYICQKWKKTKKTKKNMLILKFHPGVKCLHVFFSSRDEISSVFLTEMSSSRDEISSRQKRVNSKRHFTIDRDDFILGWNFTWKHPLGVLVKLSLS